MLHGRTPNSFMPETVGGAIAMPVLVDDQLIRWERLLSRMALPVRLLRTGAILECARPPAPMTAAGAEIASSPAMVVYLRAILNPALTARD